MRETPGKGKDHNCGEQAFQGEFVFHDGLSKCPIRLAVNAGGSELFSEVGGFPCSLRGPDQGRIGNFMFAKIAAGIGAPEVTIDRSGPGAKSSAAKIEPAAFSTWAFHSGLALFLAHQAD